MLKLIDHKKMGRNSEPDWLDSHFHFSFAEYYNPKNLHFGILRVWNDDMVKPSFGFPPHPHQNMEIISYVVDGELTHEDSMGNKHTLTRGQSQYMSAGTGVVHSEFNYTKKILRFMQIWIIPDKQGYEPNYGDFRFKWEDRINKWLPMATWYENNKNKAPIKIHADINMYTTYLNSGKEIEFKVAKGRQAYLVLLEGEAKINNLNLTTRDALEIIEEDIKIKSIKDAHVAVIEMQKQ